MAIWWYRMYLGIIIFFGRIDGLRKKKLWCHIHDLSVAKIFKKSVLSFPLEKRFSHRSFRNSDRVDTLFATFEFWVTLNLFDVTVKSKAKQFWIWY